MRAQQEMYVPQQYVPQYITEYVPQQQQYTPPEMPQLQVIQQPPVIQPNPYRASAFAQPPTTSVPNQPQAQTQVPASGMTTPEPRQSQFERNSLRVERPPMLRPATLQSIVEHEESEGSTIAGNQGSILGTVHLGGPTETIGGSDDEDPENSLVQQTANSANVSTVQATSGEQTVNNDKQ